MTEAQLQEQVAHYIRLQYPNAMFHSDFGSGIKLTMGQAAKQKRQNGGRRAWPDMFIAEPQTKFYGPERKVINHNGLFLELKKEGVRVTKKDGTYVSNSHILEQAHVLHELRDRGYIAEFAVGFEEARKWIDWYLGGKE